MDFLITQLREFNLNIAISTKNFGPIHPKGPNFTEQFARVKVMTGYSSLYFPHPAFTNNAKWFNYQNIFEYAKGFVRTNERADAGISTDIPIGMFNGDCPLGLIIAYDKQTKKLIKAFMHLGLMTMISESNRSSLIEETVAKLNAHHVEILHVWLGYGAGPCCYGFYENDSRFPLIQRWDDSISCIKYGPRQNQRSVDTKAIAKAQLVDQGIDENLITIHEYCTCCSGISPEEGKHFSNLMQHGKHARNVTIAYFNRHA